MKIERFRPISRVFLRISYHTVPSAIWQIFGWRLVK